MKKTFFATVAAVAMMASAPSFAGEYDEALHGLADAKLKAIAASAEIVAAVKAQNEENAGLGQADIDALDQQWRAQVGGADRPLIDAVLGAAASAQLVAARDESEGLFTEIFVMDNHGLNVAASDVTSDYWQGDEAKWSETFKVGPDAVHVSEVELDESTQSYQSQVSLPVVDPATNSTIGAITFGVSIENLE